MKLSHVLTLCAAVMCGCSATQVAKARDTVNAGRVKAETAVANAVVSDRDEEALGLQVQQAIEKQGVKYSSDSTVTSYVSSLAAKLAAASGEKRLANVKVFVIEDPKTVNAFATPGNRLYVYTGLLLTADNEAEVAGVLGHELGHVAARHVARQLVQQYGLEMLGRLALGEDPNTIQQIAAAVVGNGAMLAHSRADENEADVSGVHYAASAGYAPNGIATFFEKLLKTQGHTPRVLTWLQTHPSTEDRIRRTNELIASEGLRGNDVGADRLAAIKQRLGGAANLSQR